MPQRGIQPLLNSLTVVMRNGATFTIQTTMRRSTPYFLQVDTTTNPTYTGEKAGLTVEDERVQKLMSRYEGFVAEDDAGQEQAAEAARGSSSGGSGGGSSGGSRKTKK